MLTIIINPHICADCGRIGVPSGLIYGHQAIECKSCLLRWWYTHCFADKTHIVDQRHCRKCKTCGYYHCVNCQACDPLGGCKCDGAC